MKIKSLIESNLSEKQLIEVAFSNNMGFEEMYYFYQKATSQQIEELEKLIDQRKEKEAWELVQYVTGMKLQGRP